MINKSWHQTYKHGLSHLKKNDIQKAFECGLECAKIINSLFYKSCPQVQIDLLEQSVQTTYLLKKCSAHGKCSKCEIKQLIGSIKALQQVHKNLKLSIPVRLKAGELIKILNKDLETYPRLYKNPDYLHFKRQKLDKLKFIVL